MDSMKERRPTTRHLRSSGVLGDDHYNHQRKEADEERMHEEELYVLRNRCLTPARFVSVVQARLVEALPTLTCCNVVGKHCAICPKADQQPKNARLRLKQLPKPIRRFLDH